MELALPVASPLGVHKYNEVNRKAVSSHLVADQSKEQKSDGISLAHSPRLNPTLPFTSLSHAHQRLITAAPLAHQFVLGSQHGHRVDTHRTHLQPIC